MTRRKCQVCTKDTHKGRGLCKLLLSEAISRMRSNGFRFSALHCSNNLVPVYRSVGFVSAPIKFVNRVFYANESRESSVEADKRIHQFDSGDRLVLEQLIQMHQHSNLRFNGCVERQNPDYWTCKFILLFGIAFNLF